MQTPLGISPPSFIVGYQPSQDKLPQDTEKEKRLVCGNATLDGKTIVLCH